MLSHISYSNSFKDVKNIVNTLSKKELNHICTGTFKNSPYVIYREVLLIVDDPVAFIDVYSIPKEMKKDEAVVVCACKKEYRGNGYIKTLGQRMISKLKLLGIKKIYWETTKSNLASSSIAKDLGFTKSKDINKDDDNYVLFTESTHKSCIQEIARSDIKNGFLENGDSCYNLNKWPNEYNILFITGISGGGKTTLGIAMAKEFKCNRVELDYIAAYYLRKAYEKGRQNKFYNKLKLECPEAVEFLDKNPIEKVGMRETWSDTEDILYNFCNWFINKVYKNGKVYIINGAYLYNLYDTTFFYDKPIIIKDINIVKTIFRRTYRELIDDSDATFFNRLQSAYRALKTGLSKGYIQANNDFKKFNNNLKQNATTMEQVQYNTLYHGSHNDIKGNTINIANKSYEDKDYVFATYDMLFALCFAGNPLHDGIFNLSYYNGELTLIEKQSGALKKTFDTDGYIYIISDSDISKFKARSKHVLISDKSVKYSERIYIKNVLDELKLSNIKIYKYPSKPSWFNNKFDNDSKE